MAIEPKILTFGTNKVGTVGGKLIGYATPPPFVPTDVSGCYCWLDADDTTWSSSTITARYAVIYDASPATNATRPLIGYVDFGSDQSSSNGNFTITWDATGIVRITVA